MLPNYLSSAAAKRVAHEFLKARKKVIVEFSANFCPNDSRVNPADGVSLSFPTIPSRGIDPWLNRKFYEKLPSKPLLHLRSRDFATQAAMVDFLKLGGIAPALADILVIYGDGAQNARHGLPPADAIALLKELSFRTGCVFNPVPIFRTKEEELSALREKLNANPDFAISQCAYNIDAVLDFYDHIPKNTPIFVGLGYWPLKTNFKKMRVSPFDANGNLRLAPSEDFVAKSIACPRCRGAYICDYSKT